MSDSESVSRLTPFVFARRFRDLPDALLAKTVLDSASIECILSDENTIRMDWFWSNLLGGVKLWVREEDADSMQDLFDQPIPERFEVTSIGEFQQQECPNCQSLDVVSPGSNSRIPYFFFFLRLCIPLKLRGWSCRACGHRWQEDAK